MYGYDDVDPYMSYQRESYDRWDPDGVNRLRLVVYVDGRLVDTWTEPVSGSRWADVAKRFDEERGRPAPPPHVPTYERALAWLDDVCGSREAVLSLTETPLVEDGLDLPEAPTPQAGQRLSAVAELLDAVCERCFDAETSFAFRRTLLRVWAAEPEVVLDAATAAHVAGGICWAVGKANLLFRPSGEVTMNRVRDALALHPAISTYGKVVERALVGYREPSAERWWRPQEIPELLVLGHPDLLLGSVRARLVRVRTRALAAEETATAA